MVTMTANPMVSEAQELSQVRWEFLLMHIVLHQGTFDQAYAHLQPDMISNPSEMHYRHIWQCIRTHWEEFGRRPSYEALCVTALEAVAADHITKMDETIGNQILDQTQEVLDFMYNAKHTADKLEPPAANFVLRELLLSRGPQEELVRSVSTATIGSLPEIVAKAQRRIEDIVALGNVDEAPTTVPKSWKQLAVPKFATGVEWIDSVMGGGGEPGNCNVIIGPTGGGKTTVAMQIAVSTARLQNQLARRGTDGKPGLVVFISYEDDLRMLQIRANSNAANVLKDRLRNIKDDPDLSSVGNLQNYELDMYANSNIPVCERLGEKERIDEATPWLNKYIQLVDFHDPAYGGRGGIMEVKTKLTALQDKHCLPIKTVIMDWAGNMVSNYLQGKDGSIDGSKMSLELQNLINRAKHEIASPFGCTVWIPHQLTGKCNKASPAHFPHHSDAQWCSTFSDHAWYAFVLGTKDKEHSICQFGATKTRHGETPAPIILKIDGAYCRMKDVSTEFQIDKISGRLVPSRDAAKFHTPDEKGDPASTDVNSR